MSGLGLGLRVNALRSGSADPISILGAKLAAWYTSDPSTLFTTSTGETQVTAAGNPVGLRVNRVSGGPNASQATATDRPTYQAAPSRLVYDGSDDALALTVPAGGWSGTFFNATTQGVIVGTYSVPAGTYQLPTNPLYKDSINNDVGIILCDGVASAQEIADTIQWLRDNAGAGGSVYTGSWVSRFRGRTDITTLDIGHWDTGGVNDLFAAWHSCSALTSFPLLNYADGTNLSSAWFGCSGLTSFPLLSGAKATAFQGSWSGCTNLADFPANFFDGGTATNFTNAFASTALTQTSIDNILVSINSNGTSNGTFGQSGGSAPSATGQAAIDALRARGWTVTVTGGY